jgi:transcription-repair coupling factor (superfamily II helicase)
LKGEPSRDEDLEPDINVRIPALIPDAYIADIRTRLSYYKALSEIEGPEDLERIEDELRDQFGKPPEAVMNLMGLMLIRRVCKSLSVRDLSSGKAQISLTFTERTRLSAEKVVELSLRANKKYGVSPDHRLNIRMNEITWPHIYDELVYLESLIH